MDAVSPAARLSNYRLERLLGSGGMGSVYLARDLALDRLVAIKFITPDKATDDGAQRRLIREARAAAALDHPNICGVHEVIVEPEGRACIVMQYAAGQTLAERLREGPLDARQALSIAADVAAALEAAHEQNIIHRDVKPQNIMLTSSHGAKLLDFGLAVHSHIGDSADRDTTATQLTAPGVLVGTLPYMSPEQVAQRPLDARTDLFSLGAVLFECLTGRRAFVGPSSLEIATQILHDDPPRVASVRPELTEQHDELCRRLMAKHPDDRFRSASELLGVLRVFLPDSHRSHSGGSGAAGGLAKGASGTSRAGGGTGAKGTMLASRSERVLAATGVRPFRPGRAAAIAAMMLIVAAAAAMAVRSAPWQRSAPAPSMLVGVLPFRNDSGSTDNDPVVAGLRDAIATRLGTIKTLRVLPQRDTQLAMSEAAEPAGVARSLGATLVVDGALVRAGDGLEVVASLVPASGPAQPIGRYRHTGDPVQLHRRITDDLVTALNADAGTEVGTTQRPEPTENREAFAEYSQARAFLERPDVPGNVDHAIRLFRSAVAKDSRFVLAHAGLAEAYWTQYGETKDLQWPPQAVAANLEALRIDPDHAEVRMSLAVMYSGQGRYEEAIEELEKVMKLQPGNDDPYRVLADIYIAGASWDLAIEAALRAVERRPSYWRNHSQLGFSYFRAGRFDQAISAYERVVQLQPDSARGHQTLGTALQSAGRNDEAMIEYEKAIAIRPSFGAYSNVGTLYFWRGDYASAANNFERAVALSPNDPELHANLGDAYARTGERARAAQSYRQASALVQKLLAISPNNAQQLAALALYQAKLGQREAAVDAFEKAMAISPADGQVLYVGALVHALGKDAAAGCAVLTQAIKHGASVEEIRNAGELRALDGCAPYDQIVKASGKQED